MQCRAFIHSAGRVKRQCLLGWVGAVFAMLLLTAPALAASSGQRLWVSTYRPASGGAAFADVAAGAQGEAYVAGSKHVDQSLALVLLKYDGDGHRTWAHAFRGDYRLTTGGAVGLDARGNVYVGGGVGWRSGEGGILLVKYAPDGTRRWSRTWNPMHGTAEWNADILASMAVDGAGNVYLAALSNIGWSDEGDGIAIPGLVLAKYDARGKRLWAVRYRDASEPTVLGTIPDDLALDGEGNVYLACAGSFFRDFNGTASTALTLKFSGADGSLLASAVYVSPRQSSPTVRDALQFEFVKCHCDTPAPPDRAPHRAWRRWPRTGPARWRRARAASCPRSRRPPAGAPPGGSGAPRRRAR